MEDYPVTHIIPRGRVLSKVPLYLAYDHSGSGHYNLVVEETTANSGTVSPEPSHVHLTDVPPAASPNSSTKSEENYKVKCPCGRGAAGKGRENEFCKTHKSRCPCFRAFQSCNDFAVAVRVPIRLVGTCETQTTWNHFPEREQSKTFSKMSAKQIEATWKREPKSQKLKLGWKMNIYFLKL